MGWFNSLSALEKTYFIIACVASVFLIIQILFMVFGGDGGARSGDGDADADGDIDGDGASDGGGDSGVTPFSVKGIVAFFAVGGWTGLLMLSYDVHVAVSVIVSLVAGGAALVAVWLILRSILKLQDNGTLVMEKIVGKTATVYVSIPPKRSGRGKVTMTAQGRFTELDAVSDEEERIPVDETVEVVEVVGDCLIVKRKEA